jgi:hypothetical protein
LQTELRIQTIHRALGKGWAYLGVYRPRPGRKGEPMDVVRTPAGFLYGRPLASSDDRWAYLSEAEWGNGLVKDE